MVKIHSKNTAPPLKRGDEFIAISISSPLDDENSLSEGLKVLQGWGLVCRSSVTQFEPWGYLAGSDDFRYDQLHPKIKTALIAFTRGGWGAARLLERPQAWENGWLLGFSDITSILLSRLSEGYDGGIHGPLVTSLGYEPDWSKERLKAILFGSSVPELRGEAWVGGRASGPLVAANLTVGTHLIGSRHMPNLEGAILILEDTNEEPYRIDRMLTHWRLTGLLTKISGLAFGDFNNCVEEESNKTKSSFVLEEVLKERCFDLGIPVIGKLPIGHCCGNAAIPMGRPALIDGNKGTLTICS
ncbi:LD-carboxypeptidase [Prochlorococcus sp. MIT 1223]|uniref:S66 peptidase family protein n=1 Tax=Prochlorococcus sp. MIT 1223 TaxID=3096217 RepID=UPI002A75EDE2|nr:LD-carboxypeptidase [Prochlorococcus sp. MIT 1223]